MEGRFVLQQNEREEDEDIPLHLASVISGNVSMQEYHNHI